MSQKKPTKNGSFFSLIKNLFILLLFIQFAPTIFMNIKDYFVEAITPKSEVGYLKIKGTLDDSTFYVNKIQEFAKNPSIKALLLKIESPGGMPGTGQAIFSELKRFKKEKPIVVFSENFCASGAYNIAIAANHIITTPSALVGSIGVFLQLPLANLNIKDLLEKWNIKTRHIQSGKYKTAGSALKEMTPEEKEYLQKLSNDDYEIFINDVANSRNLDITDHLTWADGKVFTGSMALKLKLIDQLGSLHDALDKIKELAQIEDEIKLIQPARPSFFMRFFGSGDGELETQSSNFIEFAASTLNSIWGKFLAKQTEM
jgi:protease IV